MTQLKQAAGILGLIAAIAGIALNHRVIIWIAIGLLGVSLALRMLISARARRAKADDLPLE